MNNHEIAKRFEEIADLLSIKGEQVYRVLAYRRAAEAIDASGHEVQQLWKEGRLKDIPGVGEAIAGKIDELLTSGSISLHEKLSKEFPPSLVEVLRVGDVGPKKAALFWGELGIATVDELEMAARAGKLRGLPGMGARSEARILESIESMRRHQTDRILLGVAWPTAQAFLERFRDMPAVEAAEAAGSLRRWRETVGDLDLLIATSDPPSVIDAFVGFPEVDRVRGKGDTKASVVLKDGLRIQVWVHPPERFGSALQYATGSKDHNVRLREHALKQGLSLSEHGFKGEGGEEILCSREEQVYETVGLPWIPPELREDQGEIQAALEASLPALVTLDDIQGDLQSHSDWSDGSATLERMAAAAQAAGLRYLVVTDHSRSLGVANGLSVERLREQRQAIREAQAKLGDDFRLLQGTEVEILADGKLDYPDEILAELDLVVASLHTTLRQPREKITQRLLGAIGNPHVDVIGHPTGRLIGRREGADLHMQAIFQAAAEHGVALEINANPERLDLNDAHARRALAHGCLLAIDTDAHHPENFELMIYGVATARRAWVSPEQVVNTWDLERLLAWLADRG